MSLPPPEQIWSLPPRPLITSPPPRPMITSRPEAPLSLSSPWVPTIVARERLHTERPPPAAVPGGGANVTL